MEENKSFDVIVVGAGFAGLYALHKLKSLGFSVLVLETADDLGGTWYWNRYPGARCDVNSLEYSYQFSEELQQEWNWSEKYAPQSEILAYANHVAERFNLRPFIQFGTRVKSMKYDEESSTWHVATRHDKNFNANFCIMATGCLSKPNIPDIPGLDSFQGTQLHTGLWPKDRIEFSGKRVGIIGTGSSAIQSTPIIAETAERLTVFQRTPSFSVPAHNGPMNKTFEATVKADYPAFRAQNSQRYAALDNSPSSKSALTVSAAEREEIYEQRWQEGGLPFLAAFKDLNVDRDANRTAVDFIHGKIESIVKDSKTALNLSPETLLGCKRLCVDTDYYATFNRENVDLVSLEETPIKAVTPFGISTTEQDFELDMLILATGFDAMTGALLAIDIRGKDGQTLEQKWQDGPSNYLGLTVHGFPNFFTITGPGSPSVLANMVVAIEQHVEWIADCLLYLKKNDIQSIEAALDAETNWVNQVNKIADRTLLAHGCASWYTGANIPGKPRIFMPYLGYPDYVSQCEDIASSGYKGFQLR
ncbi:MAG: flavin-containing monooxygenase [Pseudohongiellaceae bacterium]